MEEIFGSNRFVGEIYWESKTKSQNTLTSFNKLQPKAEMIFVYSKAEKRRFNLIKVGEKKYDLSDSKGNYREHALEVMNANGIRGRDTMIFDISDGVSSVSLPEGKQWQIGQAQVEKYKENNLRKLRILKIDQNGNTIGNVNFDAAINVDAIQLLAWDGTIVVVTNETTTKSISKIYDV